jgi:hypothetical protein
VPLDWALTQNSLANALLWLGEREGRIAPLEEAVAAYDSALEVFTAGKAEHYANLCRENRQRAAALLADRRGG